MSANDIGATISPVLPAVLATAVGLVAARRARARGGDPLEAWMKSWLIVAMGLAELAAVGWFWVSEPSVAHQTGYRVSPFEWEVAGANLATLVGVVIAVRHRSWRVPVATFSLVFLLNAVAGHIYQALAHGDHKAGNTFGICIGDIVIPAAGLILARRQARQASPAQPPALVTGDAAS